MPEGAGGIDDGSRPARDAGEPRQPHRRARRHAGGAAAAARAAKPVPAQLPDVLARVNGEAVKKADFDRLIKNMELSANQPIPADRRDEILRGALDQLVTYTVLSQETKRAQGRRHRRGDRRATSSRCSRSSRTEEEFKKALAARGMTLEKLRKPTRASTSASTR